MWRLWPHKLLGEGHFVAVLRKTEGAETDIPAEAPQKLPKVFTEFAAAMDIHLPKGKAVQFGTALYWAPEALPQLRFVKVLRPGLELGEVKKDRFEPAHALALWLKTCRCTQELSADGETVGQYLHGLTIPSRQKGWCLVTVDGYSIGWGKGDANVLKNHYPKGLRR